MDPLDSHLSSTQLLDCEGRVTHTLTLLIDGRVRVDTQSWSAVVDTGRRIVDPPSIRVPDTVLDAASTFARTTLR